MARINAELLQRLQTKLNVRRSRVYAMIDAKVRQSHLPRHVAAIAVASEHGINISRYATAEDLAMLRQAGPLTSALSGQIAPQVVSTGSGTGRVTKKARVKVPKRRGNTVFVVHGRDIAARDSIFAFLRAVGLRPLEWTQALKLTRRGSPYVGEVLEAAFREAAAVVVLLTPDDEARLRKNFIVPRDPDHEKRLTGQARPNVLFEAGMAFGKNANSTILVQLGEVRPFSDVGGRHVLHLNDSPAARQEFATKLENAGCLVDKSGSDWLSAGSFSLDSKAGKRRGRAS